MSRVRIPSATHSTSSGFTIHTKYNIGTKKFSRIKLIYSEKYPNRKSAEKRERQLKGWTHAKKKALAEGNIELLKQLSKS